MQLTIKNTDTRFLPILLGTDANAYGMARSFHEAYGSRSLVLGKFPLLETRHSKIIEVQIHKNFEQSEVFLSVLDEVASTYAGYYDHLLLIACGDRYSELICENREHLRRRFIVPYIDNDLKRQLENKEDFYKICEQHGLPYPKTHVVTSANKDEAPPFSYPVAVKASDSIEYVLLDFPGKKKSYRADNLEEYRQIVHDIYAAGYQGHLIVQDFIPGDDATMYVLNAYSNAAGRVQMMCLGRCVLEDKTPEGIGNYNAIIQEGNTALYQTYQAFLETIGFQGFANFDLKYDERDKTYKVFEINIRQGRSSYFATASGANLATWLVRDVVEDINLSLPHYHDNPHLWLHVPPRLVLEKAPERTLPQLRQLLNERRNSYTLLYQEDRTPYRLLMINRFYHQQWKRHGIIENKRSKTIK